MLLSVELSIAILLMMRTCQIAMIWFRISRSGLARIFHEIFYTMCEIVSQPVSQSASKQRVGVGWIDTIFHQSCLEKIEK